MDHEILVTTFRNVVQTLRQRTGHVALFLLNALDSENTSWNILVSTQGYDSVTIKTALNDFMTILENTLEKNLLKNILRVTILKTSDPFVKAMNQAFDVTDIPQYLHSCTLLDVYIERGILFESQPYVSIPKASSVKKSRGRKRSKAAVPVI